MKNKILIAAALAFSLSTYAQQSCNNTCGVGNHLFYANDKLPETNHHVGNTTYSLINPQWEIAYNAEVDARAVKTAKASNCYRMTANKMFGVNKGVGIRMDNYVTLQNGDMILSYGTMITHSGEIVHLKNGDIIDAEGTLTNIYKTDIIKEQATL